MFLYSIFLTANLLLVYNTYNMDAKSYRSLKEGGLTVFEPSQRRPLKLLLESSFVLFLFERFLVGYILLHLFQFKAHR